MTTVSWLLSAIPTLGLFGLAWVGWRQMGSWLAPSALFSLYWAVGLLFPLVFAPEFNMWPGAPWLILVFGYALHLGALGGWGSAGRTIRDSRDANLLYLRWGARFFLLAAVAGLIGSLLLIAWASVPWMTLVLHPGIILEIGRINASARYSFGESPPASFSVLSGVQFLAGCLFGVWIAVERSAWRRLLGAIPILLSVLQSFLVNARSGFAWLIVFVVSTNLAAIVLKRKHERFFSLRRVGQAAFAVGLFATFLWIIQVAREDKAFTNAGDSARKTRAAFLAEPMSFSHWLRSDWDAVEPEWGARTMSGVYSLAGLSERRAGASWDDDPEISLETDNGTGTNVYTAFRQLIADVTVPGSIVVFFLLGLVSGRAYRRVSEGAIAWLPVLALFYAQTLGSYLANWLTYNSCVLAWFLFVFMIGPVGPRLLRWRVPSLPPTTAIDALRPAGAPA